GRPLTAELNLMVDVSNPLLGDTGTSIIFAPQKGAKPADVQELEKGLSNLWLHCYRNLNQNIDFPSAGAAGGLPAGFSLMENVSIGSGFELIADLGELEEKLAWCDLLVTGEGAYDFQSQMGKAPGRLIALAKSMRKKTAVIAGSISVFDADYNIALQPGGHTLEEAARLLVQQVS
ncbi:MAG TPA: glycerate kinase, partial [Fimbriimonas sp.]|nr:glycerate kinase [Fimbriimonas sp.]